MSIDKWKESNCFGTVVGATGVGKTRIALMCLQRVLNKNPWISAIIVVPTRVLKKQWESQLTSWNINATVLVMNTAAKKSFHCDFLVIDECHHVNSEILRKIFNNCSPSMILGLTATYERLDGKEKEVLNRYAPVCDTISLEEAKQNGWVSKYVEYKVLLDVDLTEYDNANRTFMNNFAFFNFAWDDFMNCVTNPVFRNKYAKAHGYTVKEVSACAFTCNKAMQFRKNFILNHPKKLEIAKKILSKRPDKKAITFNGSINRCKEYGSGYILHSQQSKKENQKIIEEFEKQPCGVIHTSKIADEGLDVDGLNLAIITGFTSSQIAKRQRIGRTIRFAPNKEAEVFTLVLNHTQEDKWFKKSSEDLYYVEITEDELDDILDGKELLNKKEVIQEQEQLFRF